MKARRFGLAVIGLCLLGSGLQAPFLGKNAYECRLYSSDKRAVVLPYPGTITEVVARKGDRVKRGAPLFRYRLEPPVVNEILRNLAKSARPRSIASLFDARREDIKKAVASTMLDGADLTEKQRENRDRFIGQAADDAIAAMREQFPSEPSASSLSRVFAQTTPVDADIVYVEDSLSPGAAVQPSTLMIIGDNDPMTAVIQLAEREARQLSPGDKARVDINDFPQKTFEANVIRISAVQDSPENDGSSLYEVELAVPNPDRDIKDGFKARVTFDTI